MWVLRKSPEQMWSSANMVLSICKADEYVRVTYMKLWNSAEDVLALYIGDVPESNMIYERYVRRDQIVPSDVVIVRGTGGDNNAVNKVDLHYKNLLPGDLIVALNAARLVVSIKILANVVVEVTWLPVWGTVYGLSMYTIRYTGDCRVLDGYADELVRCEDDDAK